MDFSNLEEVSYYTNLGYVILLASILTLLTTGIYKAILKKRKLINEGTSPTRKDQLLSRAGRVISIFLYSTIYLLNEYLKSNVIEINGTLLTGLLTGGSATLITAKGIYTKLHQWRKQKAFDRNTLKTEIESLKKEESKQKWIIKGDKN